MLRAPELLRNPLTVDATADNYVVGELQKADIYSFSIVLYQLQTRFVGPFGPTFDYDDKRTLEQLLTSVVGGLDAESFDGPPYRPSLSACNIEPFVQGCITDGWHENPLLRPDVKVLSTYAFHPANIYSKSDGILNPRFMCKTRKRDFSLVKICLFINLLIR